MKRIPIWSISGVIVLAVAAWGSEAAARTGEACFGVWHGQQDGALQFVVEKSGDLIHVKELRDGKVRAEYSCRPNGKECEFKEEGHKAKVSLWFNVPYLVEMRVRGENVTKRRFLVKDNPETMQLEVMPMFPPGKTEVVLLSRTTETAAR